jgi:hypothetical protein
MNRSLESRLKRIEEARARRQQQEIAAMAAEHGLTYHQFMAEAEAFFSLSLEDQLAEIDRIAAELQAEGMSWDDVAEIKATLVQHYRS